jgi:hypothetical protein
MISTGLVLRLPKETHENSRNTAGQESVRLRTCPELREGKRGKWGKREENPKNFLLFLTFHFPIFPLLHKGLNPRK